MRFLLHRRVKFVPCYHLHDEQVSSKTDIESKINIKNSLKTTNFYDIITSDWYSFLLKDSWNKNHPLHLPRCYLSCGDFNKRKVIK